MKEQTKALKPCPFCGGTAQMFENHIEEYYVDYYVKCPSCQAESYRSETENGAINLWNYGAHRITEDVNHCSLCGSPASEYICKLGFAIECSKCGNCSATFSASLAEAITEWNKENPDE